MNAERIKAKVADLKEKIAELETYISALRKQPDDARNRRELDVASALLLKLQGNVIALRAANQELLKAARQKDYYG